MKTLNSKLIILNYPGKEFFQNSLEFRVVFPYLV